jgi:tetratricopeptide (TPR) repeat protein
VTSLAVPESLQALIAARLDALPAEDRSLLQHGAVLGQSFTVEALAAISGRPAAELEPVMRGLVRRELLVLDTDPRSAERGQYRFLQALVKEVAYSTLARRDRRTRHLAAARYFESLGDEELAGALANHYLAAYQAAGDSPGSDALAAQARIALRAAADRATALHSNEQALAFFERAIEITPAGVEQAALRERAADSAQTVGRYDLGDTHLRSALELYRAADDAHGIANATAWLGVSRMVQSDVEGAVTMLESALAQMADRKQTAEYATVASELARAYAFQSNYPASLALIEPALVTSSRLGLRERIVELLITKAWALVGEGRWYEHAATLRGALAMAERLGLLNSELRARNNLADVVQFDDPREALEIARVAIERAERVGWRSWSSTLVGEVGFAAIAAGEWQWLRDSIDESYSDELPVMMRADLDGSRAILAAAAGDIEAAEQHAARLRALLETGASDQDRLGAGLTAAQLSLYSGDVAAAQRQAMDVLDVGIASGEPDQVLLLVARTALWQGDAEALRRAYEGLDAARPSRLIDATRRLIEAALASLDGRSAEAKQAAREAIDAFRALDVPFELALAQLGVVALFGGVSEEGRAAAEEARETLTRLDAHGVLARLDELVAVPGPWAPPVGPETTARRGGTAVRSKPEGS